MKRWHEDLPVAYREWKKHHRFHVSKNIDYGKLGRDPWQVECVCDRQIGRFRKKDAWDCGNAHCLLCHSDKFPKRELTYQELCANLKLKEGLEELWLQD